MKTASIRVILVFSIVFIFAISFSYIIPVHAAEPSLEEILDYLGFTNRAVSSVETFLADTYEITLYAEFAGYADQNELSYYEVGTNNFTIIFTGPEGGYDYLDPPLTKSFAADYQSGLSMFSRENFRYFTETSRNGDGLQHAKIYENLDDPGMFLIGFENQWGGGDKDYNDLVFSLKSKQPPVACFDYSPLCPVANESVTFNASESYDPEGNIVSYEWNFGDGNITAVNEPVILHIYTAANSTMNYTVTLMVTDNDGLTHSTSTTVPVTNPAVLHVSIPDGEDRTNISDPDPWLNECWLLNITGTSGTFTVRIEDVSKCTPSYDTRLVIALNDAAYNNLDSLTVNSITIVKSDFKYGTLRPYNLWNWPSGDIYPTWFNDTLVNMGTIPPKGHTNVTVSVTFSNATGARMHFDAFGSTKSSPIPPTKKCYINHNPLSKDSTVLFSAPPIVRYYLTVISPYGTPSGEGWYDNCTDAYAGLNMDIVDHGNGTRRVFTHWSGDASGTSYASSDPIHMDRNKTAVANWQTQYYVTLAAGSGGATDPPSSRWSDAGTTVCVKAIPDVCYVFDHWLLDSVDVGSANPYCVLMDSDHALYAMFTQISYDLTVSAGVGGTTDPVPDVYTHPCDSSVQVEAIPDSCYVFDHWELDSVNVGSANPYTVLMDDDHSLHAVFAQVDYTLTITATAGGTTDPIPGVYSYPCGSSVSVEAVPDSCYVFDHWELDSVDVGSANPYSVLMDDDHVLHAVFTKITYQLTITTTSGGTTDPVSGAYSYACGSSVQVEVIPDSCYVFDHWELDSVNVGSTTPYSVLMDDDHTLHAVFIQITYQLTVTATSGGSTVPVPGVYTHPCDSSVLVEAVPDACYVFDHWELDGGNVGSVNPYSVLMDDDHTLHAVFAFSPPSLSVSISPPSASIVIGDSVSFTSTLSGGAPPYSYQWYLDDAPVSGATSSSWTFKPTSTVTYYVYLKVTDGCNSTAQSETAKITVRPSYAPVGGYSVSLTKSFAKAPLICYTMLLAIFGVAICLIRRKRK